MIIENTYTLEDIIIPNSAFEKGAKYIAKYGAEFYEDIEFVDSTNYIIIFKHPAGFKITFPNNRLSVRFQRIK